MVYPLVDFLLVVQHHKGLRRDGVAIEDETQVTALTLHIREVDQGGVQSIDVCRSKMGGVRTHYDKSSKEITLGSQRNDNHMFLFLALLLS